MEKTTLIVEGMSCMHCANAVKQAVATVDSSANTTVFLDKKEVVIEHSNPLNVQKVKDAIEEEGYTVE